MDKKAIKQMKRDIITRKLARLIRLYGQNASEMILATLLVPAGAWVLFTETWAIFG